MRRAGNFSRAADQMQRWLLSFRCPQRGQVRLSLYFLDATASCGIATATERAGDVAYEVRISGESEPREKGFEGTLTIGFTGRITKLSDKRVTWAAKSFKAKEWGLCRRCLFRETLILRRMRESLPPFASMWSMCGDFMAGGLSGQFRRNQDFRLYLGFDRVRRRDTAASVRSALAAAVRSRASRQ